MFSTIITGKRSDVPSTNFAPLNFPRIAPCEHQEAQVSTQDPATCVDPVHGAHQSPDQRQPSINQRRCRHNAKRRWRRDVM